MSYGTSSRPKINHRYFKAALQGDPANPGNRASAFMKLDKLIINNQTFTCETINYIPEYIHMRVDNPPSMKTTDKVTIFFGRGSLFSNFHSSEFTVDDQEFVNVEQYITYQKALLFNSNDIARDILSMTDPVLMKRKVKRLKHYDDDTWKSNTIDILRKSLTAKFTQNDSCKEAILATKDTTLGEASASDSHFGIGMSLNNHNATDQSKWTGHNIQGKVLMEVRQALIDGPVIDL